jgi:thiamine biosynthesis protein ThiS
VRIRINGEEREFVDASLRLNDLIDQLALAAQRVAVELNQQIVSRNDWEKTNLCDGDRVEIVHFVGGGSAVGGKR